MDNYTSIFTLARTVFRAETVRAKNIQNSTLHLAIKKALTNGETHKLKEAIDQCYSLNAMRELSVIEAHFEELITTLDTNVEDINARTDLILLPIFLKSDKELAKMPSLQKLEEMYDEILKKYKFLPLGSNIHIYSMPLSLSKILSFKLHDWYALHGRMATSREKSINQMIYQKNFGLNVKENKTELYFLPATIFQNKKLVEPEHPDLFDRRQMNLEQKKMFVRDMEEELSKLSKTTSYKVSMPDTIFKSVQEARFKYQDEMIHYFIDKKSKIEGIEFVVFSLKEDDEIALFAYDTKNDKLLDKMRLYPLGNHTSKENIDNIFDALADNQTFVYISKTIHDNDFFETSNNFNLKSYLSSNETDKLSPNIISDDLYL